MKILVCGGRAYADAETLNRTLDELLPTVLAHGNATGADALAHAWAVRCGCRVQRFTADWNKYGRAAGPIRNQRMLEDFKPDLVVAFPGGRGTADMICRAERAGVPVKRIAEPQSEGSADV